MKQTLKLYAIFTGIVDDMVDIAVMSMIIKFGLMMFVDTKAG